MAKKKVKSKGKQVNKTPVVHKDISNELIAAAYKAATPPVMPPVFLKVCRLCESKDGPYLNIFDADQVTAKKINELMPFSVTENDDLPHKICFRCSVKLEELHEFIQKCVKTQQNLRSAIGKNGPFITKSKMGMKLWEEKLNKVNMSNEDICNALIKKAMEGIKAIPPTPIPPEDVEEPVETKRVTRSREAAASKKPSEIKSDETDDVSLRQVKLSLEKNDSKPQSKIKSSNIDDDEIKNNTASQVKKSVAPAKTPEESKKQEIPQTSVNTQNEEKIKDKPKNTSLNNFSFDYDPPLSVSSKESDGEEEKKQEPKKFNIMDHISMIKVNGVGTLFQCKLCNRNFLKKEVVESHNCAKNGIPKLDIPKSIPIPDPPKVPSVKYIKIDGDMKKSLTEKIRKAEQTEHERIAAEESKKNKEESYEPPPKPKPKPKAGPASKTRRNLVDLESNVPQGSSDNNTLQNTVNLPAPPSVLFQKMPNLNSRFKLVPGPDNIFTLVEEPPNNQEPNRKKRTSEEISEAVTPYIEVQNVAKRQEIIDIDTPSKPYPVGFFQNVAHTSPLYKPTVSSAPTFTTPAMKKQSYTIVQTGNPSKLLISTKAKSEKEEIPKKRPKKSKSEVRHDSTSKEPYNVTLEDIDPPKDAGFFTFINVDPLLQPSYVLPTDNIIQESQISTSSAAVRPPEERKESEDKNKYTCNMCGDTFSREKKLLTHIQSHYKQMDEEDNLRAEKSSKKRKK